MDEAIHAALAALFVTMENKNWVFDSGALNHFAGDPTLFSQISYSSAQGLVTSSRGQYHPIKGKEDVDVSLTLGKIKQVKDVYYVAGISKTLMSIGQIADSRHFILFNSESCIIVTKSSPNTVVSTGFRDRNKGGLYRLKLVHANIGEKLHALSLENTDSVTKNHQQSDIAAAEQNQFQSKTCSSDKNKLMSYLWHALLGHVNYKNLEHLLEHSRVLGIPRFKIQSCVCEPCLKGKQTRAKFPKDGALRATKLLQLIHSDLCGPLPILSLGKNRYFLTIIDDFSRKT